MKLKKEEKQYMTFIIVMVIIISLIGLSLIIKVKRDKQRALFASQNNCTWSINYNGMEICK